MGGEGNDDGPAAVVTDTLLFSEDLALRSHYQQQPGLGDDTASRPSSAMVDHLNSAGTPLDADAMEGVTTAAHEAPVSSKDDRPSVQEMELRAENERLRRQLTLEFQRATKAEASLAAARGPISTSTGGAEGEIPSGKLTTEQLEAMVKQLKEDLESSRSHIFALQPYRREVTPEEVANDFEALFSSVSNWMENFVGELLEEPDSIQVILANVKKHPSIVAHIRKMMQQHADLTLACTYPDTDLDVLIAIVMRFLHEKVFSGVLYGAAPEFVDFISTIESSMQLAVQPKRDIFSIRNWRAETMNALLSHPSWPTWRNKAEKQLAFDLASLFSAFYDHKSHFVVMRGFSKNVVQPAVMLHEKLQLSTHSFFMDLDPFTVFAYASPSSLTSSAAMADPKRGAAATNMREPVTSPDFYDALPKLDCKNILQNRRTFSLAKFGDEPPSREELEDNLHSVLTLSPGVYVRQVGQRDAMKEKAVVCKQQLLVAWGPVEKRAKFLASAGAEKTLMYQIMHPTRQDEKDGGGGSLRLDQLGRQAWSWALPGAKNSSSSSGGGGGS